MQPGIQRCLRKAQNIWFFFFQCAKNCFVLNKGKRYIRSKIPSQHSQKADRAGTSQLPCPVWGRSNSNHTPYFWAYVGRQCEPEELYTAFIVQSSSLASILF